jgi:DNA repair photolyase
MNLQESQEVSREVTCGIEPAGVNPKVIKPLFGTQEWAPYSENCVVGCAHDCRYCYAKAMAIRFKRTTPQDWKNEVLRPNILQKVFHKRDGRIFFPSSHDITPAHLSQCMTFLKNILIPGN